MKIIDINLKCSEGSITIVLNNSRIADIAKGITTAATALEVWNEVPEGFF